MQTKEFHVHDEGEAKALYLKLDGLRHAIDHEGQDSIEICWRTATPQNPGEEALDLCVEVQSDSVRRMAKYDMDFVIFRRSFNALKIPPNPLEASST